MRQQRFKQWLWFVALYGASVAAALCAVYAVRFVSGTILR